MQAAPNHLNDAIEEPRAPLKELSYSLGILLISVVFIALSVLLYHLTLADLFAFQARVEYRAGRYENALENMEVSFQHWTRDPSAYQLYAQALRGMAGREQHRATLLALLREADKAYVRAIQLNPEEGDYWFGLARLRWKLNTLEAKPNTGEDLERLLLKAEEKDPNNSRYLFLMAHHFLSSGDQAKAGQYIKRLAASSPERLLKLRHHPRWGARQETEFEDGLTANRSNALIGAEILAALADAAAEKKQWGEAVKYIQSLINLLGDNAGFWRYERLANYALHQGNKSLALEAFRKSITLAPEPEKELQTLFWDFQQANELGLYKAELISLAQKNPDIKNHLPFFLGQAQLYSNQPDQAEKNLNEYLEKYPSLEAHRYLAQIALERKDAALAEYHVYRALQLDPKDHHSRYLLATALNGRGRYKEALDAIDAAIRLRGEPALHYLDLRGWIYWSLKRYKDSIADWRKIVELDPKQTDPLLWIAKAYLAQGQPVQARKYLDMAAKAMPEDPRVKQELSRMKSEGKRP